MFEKITLEMSLKPFKQTDEAYMEKVIGKMFSDWHILIRDAEEISVMLWTADGSEILDWSGNFSDTFEWSHYMGGANNIEGWYKEHDPERKGLHSRYYQYSKNIPVFTYETLKTAVSLIKKTGKALYPDKRITVGETFDPGPEFAKSDFKYNRHPECCLGGAMGTKSFLCAHTLLHKDDRVYAGYPDGIPEGLPFGTFLGRQSQLFLTDMGFDYIWLSNGFGFGTEPWSAMGAIFDGENFNTSGFDAEREKVLEFWELFRKECPNFPVETRGTNMTAGIDLATDGVPLKDIYEGNFNILPPPNSPWAALNGNFGLELVGYMSRISKLPDNKFLFRYYIHDPWWMNSPWIDRYEGLPHDIYLPMAVSRIDNNANVCMPTNLNILTVDNSFGEMPDFCAYEPIAFIEKAMRYNPDAPSPVVWVYPFDEYHSYKNEAEIREMFFGDWFIVGALNHGFPMSSVVSTTDFNVDYSVYKNSVLVSVVPDAGSEYEEKILSFIEKGGKVIFYGGVKRASEKFLKLINIEISGDERYGKFLIKTDDFDVILNGAKPDKIMHRKITCGDGINTLLGNASNAKAIITMDNYVCGTASENAVWLKGSCSASYNGGQLLMQDSENELFSGESLMRYALAKLGYCIEFEKHYADCKEPVIMLSRHENAYIFSVCAPDTTVKTKLKFPLGAPVLMSGETKIDKKGYSEYTFTKAELRECRIFVEQEEGVIGCHEVAPVSYYMSRRVKLSGLKNATIRFFAPDYCKNNISAALNSTADYYFVGDNIDSSYITDEHGTYFEARNVMGELVLSLPFEVPLDFDDNTDFC